MATFTEVNTLANDPVFQARVRVAMVKSALSIIGEPIGTMTQAQSDKRQAMALGIVGTSAMQQMGAWSLAVAINPSITSGSLDGDIEFTVNSIWDDMSGVTTADLL